MKNEITQHQIFQYLEKYYLTLDQIADQINEEISFLKSLIDFKIIPDCSYQIQLDLTVNNKAFNQSDLIKTETSYFHPSIIFEIKKALDNIKNSTKIFPNPVELTHLTIKESFSEMINFNNLCMKQLLETLSEKNKIDFFDDMQKYLSIYSKEIDFFCAYPFQDKPFFLNFISESWYYYINGIYGACLKNPSALTIFLKKLSVLAIEFFWNQSTDERKYFYEKALKAAELYEKIVMLFPDWIKSHSRNRLRVLDILVNKID